MKQKTFERIHKELWEHCEEICSGGGYADPLRLPSLHRRLSHSLSLARSRGYAPSLVDRLHLLANQTHQLLYGAPGGSSQDFGRWIRGEFPRSVRRMWPYFLCSLGTLLVPALVAAWVIHLHPDMADSFLGPGGEESLKSMFSPGSEMVGRKSTEADFEMFGFYIWNNVSLLFRTMATGVFLGIPSLLVMGYNGANIGAAFSVMYHSPPHRLPFFTFVTTHSALELTGLAIGGTASFRLGWSVLNAGPLRRIHAFHQAVKESLPVMAGASLMMVGAAFLEAFWSAHATFRPSVRVGVGLALWIAVIVYFTRAGRNSHAT